MCFCFCFLMFSFSRKSELSSLHGFCNLKGWVKFIQFGCSVVLILCNPWTTAFDFLSIPTALGTCSKLIIIESVMPFFHLILWLTLLLLRYSYRIRVFQCRQWSSTSNCSKYWSFSISTLVILGCFISVDWFVLTCGQGTLKRLLNLPVQKHQFTWCSAFFSTPK